MCHSGWSSPDIFCGARQEFHECLVLEVEEDDLLNMEKKIWEGLGRSHGCHCSDKRPHTGKSSLTKRNPTTDGQSRGAYPLYFTGPASVPEQEGVVTPQDLALVPRRQPQPPPRFSPQVPEDLSTSPLGNTYLPGATTL